MNDCIDYRWHMPLEMQLPPQPGMKNICHTWFILEEALDLVPDRHPQRPMIAHLTHPPKRNGPTDGSCTVGDA